MNFSLKRLVDDHLNLKYTLQVLARRVQQCKCSEDILDSSEFIMATLDYLCDYPQQFHHPIEERLIRFLEEDRHAPLPMDEDIAVQHRELEASNALMREQLAIFMAQGGDETFARLKDSLLIMVSDQLFHLESEDRNFVPLIQELMSDEGWLRFNKLDVLLQPESESDLKRGEFASALLHIANRA